MSDAHSPEEVEPKALAEKALGVVPLLFYDLIARIIPGTAFVVALTWEEPPPLHQYGEATKFILLVGAGYLAGMILTGASLFWDALWLGFARYRKEPQFSPFTVPDSIDKICMVDRFLGDVLFKTLAEVTACQNTATGFVFLWIAESWFGIGTTALALAPGTGLRLALLALFILVFIHRAAVVSVRTDSRYREFVAERKIKERFSD